LNKSFAVAEAAASIEVKCVFRKNRDASFALSGSAASGLLLFSWGGEKPISE
jgi:hypothetical protein